MNPVSSPSIKGALWAEASADGRTGMSLSSAMAWAAALTLLIGTALSQVQLDQALPALEQVTRMVRLEPPKPKPKPIVQAEAPKPEPNKAPQAKPALPVPPSPTPPPAPAIVAATNPSPHAPALATAPATREPAAPTAPLVSAPPVQPPAPAPKATSVDIGITCPTQVKPEMPRRALMDESSGTVKARALIENGSVKDVTILSGPKVFHASVRNAMLRYQCVSTHAGEIVAEQEFVFKVN